MNKNSLYVVVEDDNWPQSWAKSGLPEMVFEIALDYLQKHQLGLKAGFDKPISINLSLSNNKEVQRLNAVYRGMDKPTNVLSFANADDDDFWEQQKKEKIVELGDIIIAFETLRDEAAQKNILLESHFAHLFVHGILHLFGYDHQTDQEADEMEAIEIAVLKIMNIANPYEV